MNAPIPEPPTLSMPPGQHLPCSAPSQRARAAQPRAERGCPCLLGHTSRSPLRQVQSEARRCRANTEPGTHGGPRLGRGCRTPLPGG